MGFLQLVIIFSVSLGCMGAQSEGQQAVEKFRKSTSNLKHALTEIVEHSTTEVRVVEVLREADAARRVYTQLFLPALGELTPFIAQDESEKLVSYEEEVAAELQQAVANTSVSQDELLAFILGDDVMQTDGARLEVTLRLLQKLVDRFAASSQLQEMSLATVKEVSAVAGAAMEAVMGVRDAGEDAAKDAEAALANLKDEDEASEEDSLQTTERPSTTKMGVSDDTAANDAESDNKIRNRRGLKIRFGRRWSLGLGGLTYRRGGFRFNVKPTFRGFRPTGVRFGFRWSFG